MSLFKKLGFLLFVIIVSFLLLAPSNKSKAQTATCGPAKLSFTETNTNPLRNPDNNLYILKLKNLASKSCEFTFAASASSGSGWGFKFLPITIGQPEYTSTNKMKLKASEEKQLKMIATPSEATRKTPKTYTIRVDVNPGNEYENLEYKIVDTCIRRNPDLTKRPTTDNTNNKVYNLTIENKDSANCSARSFILDRELNSGWNGIFLQEESSSGQLYSIVVQPNGGTKDFRFKVTPPSSAGTGDWIVRAIAKDGSNEGRINLHYVIGKPPTSIPIPSNPPPPPDCDRKAPLFEVTDPQSGERTGKRGDERKYKLKVTNRDSGRCDDQVFVLTKERAPNNFNVKLDDPTLKIAKGEHKSTILHVTPQNDAAKGRSTVNIGVKRQGKDNILRNLILGYTVEVKNPPPTDKPTAKPTEKPTAGPTSTTCVRNTPDFNIVPNSVTANPGQAARYDMIVENKDEGPCSKKELSFEAKTPNDNWRVIFAKENFDLEVGGKATIDLVLTSPDTATTGNKTITINIKNTNGGIVATKNVSYVVPGSECVAANPEFSITPQTKIGQPGETITYNVTVKNIDSGPCASRNLTLEVVPPTKDWDAGFFGQDFTLASGEEKVLNPSLTSPAGIAAGEYNTVLNLLNNNTDKISSIVAIYKVVSEPGKTLLDLTLGIDGIGKTPRIPIGGNQNPENKNRNLTLSLYSAKTNTLTEAWNDWTFTYNPTSQKFENELALSNDFITGIYNVYLEGAGYIRARYPGSVTITKEQTTVIDSDNFYVIAGNLNNEDTSENRIDIMDYMVLNSCWIYSQDYSLCDQNPNYKVLSDLNNDGIVNEDDYTLFLKEYGNEGAPLP